MTRFYAIAASILLASCASAPPRDCAHVYAIGDARAAAVLASGQQVAKPGPLPAPAVPKAVPRAALEADGSYAGGRVYCSVPEAKAALAKPGSGEIRTAQPMRVYEIAATWAKDVYEIRPGEYRLKHSVQLLRAAD